jgi:hypothetical protein
MNKACRTFGLSMLLIVAACATASNAPAQEQPRQEQQRLEFTRLVAHWAEYADPGYLAFIDEARPDIAQVGFYGGHFWSLAHTPDGAGYPAHFPVVGLDDCGNWFRRLNADLHARNVKVVGHFNIKFLVGDPDSDVGPRGFFKFYRDLWDEAQLGPRPVDDPRELLEVNADGSLLSNNMYSIGGMKEYWGCLNNPHWRTVLKALTRRGIERGVDGYMINYFYRHDCHCRWCQQTFRDYLATRFTPEQLHEQFGIADLATHVFPEIVAWHDPAESTPLRREMLRYSQIANKRAFDEVFVEYGRSLKPDLIVGQWNHLGDFSQIGGDERCLLPAEQWGRDEDYLWYSSGGAAHFTDLAERFLGDLTLQCRYIRGAFDDKPFTLGKYEYTRIRAAIAELAANGGAPMGFYTRFTDPVARQTITQYYQFIGRHDALYRGNRPAGECLLLFPRTRIHEGDLSALDEFKRAGRELLDQHVLFDVRPDDQVTDADRAAYGGRIFAAGTTPQWPADDAPSRFEAPYTVRVSASRPAAGGESADELTLHFVNYNRTEPAEKRGAGAGAHEELPIAAEPIACDVRLPPGWRVARIEALTPESDSPAEVSFDATTPGRVRFTQPGFLVYGVARIVLERVAD